MYSLDVPGQPKVCRWYVPFALSQRRLPQAPRRPEPGGQGIGKPQVRTVTDPGHISVRPDQYGGGSSDRSDCRELPCANVCSVNWLNPICPGSDVEPARLTEVE